MSRQKSPKPHVARLCRSMIRRRAHADEDEGGDTQQQKCRALAGVHRMSLALSVKTHDRTPSRVVATVIVSPSGTLVPGPET